MNPLYIVMVILTAALFFYLLLALIRPEKFE